MKPWSICFWLVVPWKYFYKMFSVSVVCCLFLFLFSFLFLVIWMCASHFSQLSFRVPCLPHTPVRRKEKYTRKWKQTTADLFICVLWLLCPLQWVLLQPGQPGAWLFPAEKNGPGGLPAHRSHRQFPQSPGPHHRHQPHSGSKHISLNYRLSLWGDQWTWRKIIWDDDDDDDVVSRVKTGFKQCKNSSYL